MGYQKYIFNNKVDGGFHSHVLEETADLHRLHNIKQNTELHTRIYSYIIVGKDNVWKTYCITALFRGLC